MSQIVPNKDNYAEYFDQQFQAMIAQTLADIKHPPSIILGERNEGVVKGIKTLDDIGRVRRKIQTA